MKKVIYLLTLFAISTPAFAFSDRHETYAGLRIHKNENIAFKYDIHGDADTTIRRDNFGIGAVLGNRLSDRIPGADFDGQARDYHYVYYGEILGAYLIED